MPAQLDDGIAAERTGIHGRVTAGDIVKLVPIIFPLGGQFLLDPDEFNAWGVIGPIDNINTQDLGNVGANPSRFSGGLVFPFDVRLTHLYAWHANSDASAQAWGWRIIRQEKFAGVNTATSVDILAEVFDNAGVGPRNYADNRVQKTDIDLSASGIIPAGQTITLGVESPTAVGTNYYVRIMSGYLQFARV